MRNPTDDGIRRDHAAYGPRVRQQLASLRANPPPAALANPTGEGRAGSRECGSLVTIQVELLGNLVRAASYRAYGCPATLASASETVRQIEGRTLLEAAAVGEAAIADALELPSDMRSRAATAADALHEALGQAMLRTMRGTDDSPDDCGPSDDRGDPGGVLVGMSGGVDSAAAALLLRDRGYRPVGATFKLWTDPYSPGANSCCSDEAVQRARRVAHRLGMPHFTLDSSEAFFASVVQYFLAEYSQGRTPNPCSKCNARLRFGLMADVATRLGLSKIATGHYARLTDEPARLSRGLHGPKDQSYVLAEVAPHLLERALFPLGELSKSAVRKLAKEAGLETHDAPESQDICFVPADGHRPFLHHWLGARPGDVVDAMGRKVGRHTGIYNFTVGQRRGHGVAIGEPLYVTRLDAERAEVAVGPREELAVGELVLEHITVHRPGSATHGLVQTRSSGEPLPGTVKQSVSTDLAERQPSEPDHKVISLNAPAVGVAPGQTAVLYDGDEVVLAGTIVETRP